MKRGLFFTLLAAVILTSLLAAPVLGAAAPLPVIDNYNKSLSPTLRPGGSAIATISVHLTGITKQAYESDSERISVKVIDSTPVGLYLKNADLLERTIDSISDNGWGDIQYNVSLDSAFAGSGIFLKVEITYYGATETKQFDFSTGSRLPDPVPDPDPAPAPDPTAASVSVTPKSVTIRAGQSNTISVEVVNSGEKAANNLSATLTPVGQDLQRLLTANPPAAFTAGVNTLRRAGSSSNGNRGTFTYNIAAPDSLKSGVYEFRVNGSFYHETSNNLGVFDGVIQVVVLNDFEPASMQITEVGPLYAVRSGELFNVNIQVRNTGGLTARDASVSIKNMSENAFTVMGSAAAGMIGPVGAGQSGNRTLTLRAAPAMQPGTYPLVIQLNYIDDDDRLQATEYETFIEVIGTPAAEIEMIRAAVPGGTLAPGQHTVLTIELRNPSPTDAENVRVRVSGFSGIGVYLANGENNLPTKTIDSIPAGGRASVTYNIIVSDVCNMPSLALQAEISHTLPDGSADSITENVSFAVLLPDPAETPPGSQTSVPKLIIDHYALTWENQQIQTLRAGAMFDLTFTLRNTSAITALSNITVTLSSVDGIFMPAAGSNTFFIESVDIGGEIERTIRLVVAQNAETKSYQLVFSLDYEDKDAATYRPSETLSLPVIVPLIVELANFNPPMWGDMGMQTYMMFQYINKGKGTVYNFTIDIEGDFMMPDGASTYVGNLASGYIDYFECMMIPLSSGELQGAVVLSFEDAVGNVTEMREEFTMNVNEPFYPEFPGDDFPGMDPWSPGLEDSGGGWFGLPWWVIITIGGVIVVAAVATPLLVRRRRNKKRRLLEEGDLDEDD